MRLRCSTSTVDFVAEQQRKKINMTDFPYNQLVRRQQHHDHGKLPRERDLLNLKINVGIDAVRNCFQTSRVMVVVVRYFEFDKAQFDKLNYLIKDELSLMFSIVKVARYVQKCRQWRKWRFWRNIAI